MLVELIQRAEEVGDSVRISAAYFQLAIASVNISNYTVRMLKKSLMYSNPSMRNRVEIYSSLGQAYLMIDPPKLDSAQHYLEIGNRINDTACVSLSVPLTLAETYLAQGNYSQANSIIDKVLNEPSYGSYDFSLYSLTILSLECFSSRSSISRRINL